jgi:CRISPR-associated protein Csx10
MKAITFLLHTKQPILVTSLQGDPNSDVSFSYIPGSVIRGVFIGRYLQLHSLRSSDDILDDVKFPDIKRLFFNGNTRYLNAYLYSNQEEKRTLPIPRSWLKRKGDDISTLAEITVYDFSYAEPRQNISYKSFNEGFCTVDDENTLLYQEKRRINIHNMRNRKQGRGVDGSGAIFRYDALDAGQTFQAVILCDDSDDVEKIKPLLEPREIWIGGSQSAGYGHIQISHINEYDNWNETGVEAEDREERELLRITLLSDLILRDKWGHYVVTSPTESITDDINQEAEPLTKLLGQLLDINLQSQSSYTSSNIVGGFNRKWGLPLPQVPAFAAGSVFVFKYNGQLDLENIRNLENQGIGERRVDGFGRIAINWLEEYPSFQATLPKSELNLEPPQLTPNSEESKIAAKMLKRLLEQKLDRELIEKLNSIKLQPNKLSNSQFSRLMIVARQSLTEESKNPVFELFSNLPKNANSQFEDTKINGKSFKKQVCEWLNDTSSWIHSRHLEVTIAGESVALDVIEKLKLEYTLRLIIAIAKQATKDNKDE